MLRRRGLRRRLRPRLPLSVQLHRLRRRLLRPCLRVRQRHPQHRPRLPLLKQSRLRAASCRSPVLRPLSSPHRPLRGSAPPHRLSPHRRRLLRLPRVPLQGR